jgi:ABC-type Fe3+ transport system permease subunit
VALWVLAITPLAALAAAPWLDRGPDRSARVTLFPAALSALDPLVWDCVRNSLAVAVLVTIVARVLGVGLARAAIRWRFWGRAPLVVFAGAGAVVPPAFGAVGLLAVFGPVESWAIPNELSALRRLILWAEWFWLALLVGMPLVGLATASALRRVDPLWEDAARLEGADPRRVWRQIVWPIVRPDVARALCLVFTITLLEPGAPLVLGLRRTLGYQAAEAALEGALPRAAILALAATLLAIVARELLGWWASRESARADNFPPPRPRNARWPHGILFAGALGVIALAAWLPSLGLFVAAFVRRDASSIVASRPSVSLEAFHSVVSDPVTRGYMINSAIVGISALAIDLVLASALATWALSRRGRFLVNRLSSWPAPLPPLAVGIGVLALPQLIGMVADLYPASTAHPSTRELVATISDVLDSTRTPWIAIILAVALVRLPILARSAVERRRALRHVLSDAALTLGATPRKARKTLQSQRLGVSPAAAILTLALAATSVAPALILSPTAETRPIGPAVLTLVDQPGGLPRAAALAILGIILNLSALAFAGRSRAGLPHPWSRD